LTEQSAYLCYSCEDCNIWFAVNIFGKSICFRYCDACTSSSARLVNVVAFDKLFSGALISPLAFEMKNRYPPLHNISRSAFLLPPSNHDAAAGEVQLFQLKLCSEEGEGRRKVSIHPPPQPNETFSDRLSRRAVAAAEYGMTC
jgi:hypothetical protein